MGQLAQFITNHWGLWLALIAILLFILVYELMSQKNRAKTLSPAETIDLMNHENAVVIDLRDQELFRAGHIIDAICASADDFTKPRMEKYKSKPVILVCARGLQSTALASKLKTQGYTNPLILAGGFAAWQAAGLPSVKAKGKGNTSN